MKVPAALLKAHIDNVTQSLDHFRNILVYTCDSHIKHPTSGITLKHRISQQGRFGLYAAYIENGLEHSFYLSCDSTMFDPDYKIQVINPDEPAYDRHVQHLLTVITKITKVISGIHPETTFNSFDFNAGYQDQSYVWLFSCGFITELYGYNFEYAINQL
ncbi:MULTISPECIES: hypothetical protein [Bacteroides]|jgi:hypothetical protein|uniref:Uncharacterized protein n=1 Tax=Bacteroides fragilis TaxID=817 RepID=A0A413JX00_BACFG|nr:MULTISPECIES: hypothetical protein [Bacteroides]MBU3043241.1 hypothetical protein [Bacteroides sp. HF-4919]MBY2893618.1 hypothetical protein [Bacteroides fragilis]MCM0223791.1 hypothetical protein [Bacteroides fragilis]MCM0300948.1 hypothetical protein [Bacteroides fragilis]MCM0361283.1 hypothetical protein [Bacteroides fragilis]